MKKRILFAMTLAFALLVWPVQGNSQPVVNVGITTTMSEVPLYLAMEKGWLKEAGVEVKLHRFTASGFMLAPLSEAQGVAIKWKRQSETVSPYHQTAGIFFNRDWARNNPEQATGFMLAWLKGTRAFYEAYKYGTNRKEIVDVAMKYLPIKDPGLYEKMEWPYTNPNGYLDLKSIEDQINWYFAQGQATYRLEVSQVVDHTYVEQAIKKLGEYKPRQ